MFSVLFSVVFNNCSERTHTDFMSTDTRYHVDADGTVKLKQQVMLHHGHKMFSVHVWDSKGKKHTALVRVEHQDRADDHYGQQEDVDTNKVVRVLLLTILPSARQTVEFPVCWKINSSIPFFEDLLVLTFKVTVSSK